MSAPRLALIILAVRDVERSAAFYEAAFGWPRAVDAGVYVEFRLPAGGALGIYERVAFGANTGAAPELAAPGALTGTELYFTVDDALPAIARLTAAGARPLSPFAPRAWGDHAAYFADPDGYVIVIAQA